MSEPRTCYICGKKLDQPDDPLSRDCGGDCWGCISKIEWEDGAAPDGMTLEQYRRDPKLRME